MPSPPAPEDFGPPALRVGSFQLWIHDGPAPDAGPHDDWLRVTAHCAASGASVWTQGSLLEVANIRRFGDECASLLAGHASKATLASAEPELCVEIQPVDRLGHLRARVSITADFLRQVHRFDLEIDQTWLAGIVAQCAAITTAWPTRR